MPAEKGSLQTLLVDLGLRVIRRMYRERGVRVIVIRDTGLIYTGEGPIELRRGTEYTLQQWVAERLEREGFVKIKDGGIALEDLARIAYNEESSINKPRFEKIDEYFYNLVLDEIKRIEREAREKADIKTYRMLYEYQDLLSTIGRTRLRKILGLLTIEPEEEIINRFTEEERLLYYTLKDALQKWLTELGIEKQGEKQG